MSYIIKEMEFQAANVFYFENFNKSVQWVENYCAENSERFCLSF